MKSTSKIGLEQRKKSTSPWSGIDIRCTLSGDGTVPRAASSDSPDIILAGTKPLENPGQLTTPESYQKAYDHKLFIENLNYIYVRGKNYTNESIYGFWNLYSAPSNLLMYPYLWEHNYIENAVGLKDSAFEIDSCDVGVSENAFVWIPPALPNGQSYSLIGIAMSERHGNPLAGVNNVHDLAEVLSTNANIAMRKLSIHDGDIPTVLGSILYDQGSEAALVDIRVIFKNIPKGSSYQVSSGVPMNGKTLSIEGKNSNQNYFSTGWNDLQIPANWNSAFDYSITFGNDWSDIAPFEYPSVEIRAELVISGKHKLYGLGQLAESNIQTAMRRFDSAGDPLRTINIGKHKAIWKRNIQNTLSSIRKGRF